MPYKRPCNDCKNKFQPTAKGCFTCEKCLKKRHKKSVKTRNERKDFFMKRQEKSKYIIEGLKGLRI